MDESNLSTQDLPVKKRKMWWLAIPIALVLIPAVPWLFLALLSLASTKTISTAPVKSYDWDQVEVNINSQLTIGLNAPGKSEYLLSINSVKAVPNCTNKRVDPEFSQTSKGDEVTITLKPTLSGGRCTYNGFSGKHDAPSDSRMLSTFLPATNKKLLTVVIKEGAKESRFQLSDGGTKVKVIPVSVDPQQVVFTATNIDKNPDWIFAVFSPTKFDRVFQDLAYKADGKLVGEDGSPLLILPEPLQSYATGVGTFLQHGSRKDMLYYQFGWPASGTNDIQTAYQEIKSIYGSGKSDGLVLVQFFLDGSQKQWPASPELKLSAGAAAFPAYESDQPHMLRYEGYAQGISFSYPDTLILDVQSDKTTLTSDDIADRLTISEEPKINSVEEATAHITDTLAQPPFVQAEERTVSYDKTAYVWESGLGGRAAMEVILPSKNPEKSVILYFENYDGNADVVWNMRNTIVDSLFLSK